MREEIGERLAQFRQHLQLSQKELSNSIGVVWRTYQNYEVGVREASMETIAALARVHRLNCDWLITGRGHMEVTEPEDEARHALARLLNQINKAGVDLPNNKLPALLALVMSPSFSEEHFSEESFQELLRLMKDEDE